MKKLIDILIKESIILSCSPEKAAGEGPEEATEKKKRKQIKKLLTKGKRCDKISNVDGESQRQKKTLNLEN